MMEKIAFFLPDLSGGGAERTVVNLLKELVKQGWAPELVLVRAKGVYLAEVPAQVRIVDLGKEQAFLAILPLWRYLKKNKPDVLISHLSHLNVIALLVKKLFSLPTPLILVEQAVMAPGRAKGKERLVRWGMKKFYPGADTIVAVSENTARDLEERLGLRKGKVRCIHNPVIDEELFRKAAMPIVHPWIARGGEEGGKAEGRIPLFVSVGRLTAQKGFVHLLKAFALVKEQRPARLLILGEGELRAELEEEIRILGIEGEVSMPGFVENPYTYMARADAFVLSSEWEGLPGVLIEALACGCPVVATRSPGGQEEILENGRYGILVAAGDAAALGEGMLRVLEEPVDKGKLVQRASYFSREKAVLAYTELVREVLEAPRGKGAKPILLTIITDLDTGGAERMLCNLLSGMDRRAWDPVVLSLMPGGAQAEVLKGLGIPVYTAGMQAGRRPSFGVLVRMIRLLWRIQPSLIQGWMYHGNLSAQFLRCFLFRRIPIFWSIHHSLTDLKNEKPLTQKLIRLGARISRWPDQIIYVSELSRAQHSAAGYADNKTCILSNGVDPELFNPSPATRMTLRAEWGLGPDVVLIGLLARWHPIKDHENFLRAAAILSVTHPEVMFVLAGAQVDEDHPSLQAWVRELGIGAKVRLLGERADPQRILAALDLCTLSSVSEAFPMTLLEAMSCGVPCVSTDIGDASRIIGDTGLVVPVRDPAALSAAWETLLEKGPEGRRNLGNKAREKILQSHSLQGVVREYEGLWRRFLFGNRSPS